ncbi:MAG: hypothetical protein SCALA701_05070 [Candidatus Scalindua sp.]|nr:MAG: hypothetical protein SCALA701_05070 [Candidatus Scalindua sp.]
MSRIDKAISNSRQITLDRWDSSILERTPLNTGIFPIGSITKKSVTAVETISEMLKDSLHYRYLLNESHPILTKHEQI